MLPLHLSKLLLLTLLIQLFISLVIYLQNLTQRDQRTSPGYYPRSQPAQLVVIVLDIRSIRIGQPGAVGSGGVTVTHAPGGRIGHPGQPPGRIVAMGLGPGQIFISFSKNGWCRGRATNPLPVPRRSLRDEIKADFGLNDEALPCQYFCEESIGSMPDSLRKSYHGRDLKPRDIEIQYAKPRHGRKRPCHFVWKNLDNACFSWSEAAGCKWP